MTQAQAVSIVRKDVDVNEHERLFNITYCQSFFNWKHL